MYKRAVSPAKSKVIVPLMSGGYMAACTVGYVDDFDGCNLFEVNATYRSIFI